MTYCVPGLDAHRHTLWPRLSHLIQVQSAEQRIHNSAVESLDFQVAAARGEEVISVCFLNSGWRYFPAHTAASRRIFSRDSVGIFFFFTPTTSVFPPSGHLSLIPVASVIRYVNDPSLSQMQQINQGQWVPFRSRMGRRGRDIMTGV